MWVTWLILVCYIFTGLWLLGKVQLASLKIYCLECTETFIYSYLFAFILSVLISSMEYYFNDFHAFIDFERLKNSLKLYRDISTGTAVFIKQRRVSVCEHVTKMASLESFWMCHQRVVREEGMEGNLKGNYLRLIPGLF